MSKSRSIAQIFTIEIRKPTENHQEEADPLSCFGMGLNQPNKGYISLVCDGIESCYISMTSTVFGVVVLRNFKQAEEAFRQFPTPETGGLLSGDYTGGLQLVLINMNRIGDTNYNI